VLNLPKGSPSLQPTSSAQSQGVYVEHLVETYLHTQHVQSLFKNFRCRLGEIDLIGLHNDDLIFIEIRFRRNTLFGGAAASVDRRKQQKLRQTAQYFLRRYPNYAKKACRFDVAAVTLSEGKYVIDWITNAFC
jgi:putative endonuclease